MESGNKTSVHVLIRLGIWRTLKSAAFDLRKNWCKHYLREREREFWKLIGLSIL